MTAEEYLRTRFLERIAHDARGGAGVSMTALEELELELAGREDLQPLLMIARRGLGRVMRLAESLGDAAELEGGNVTLARARVDVGELATRAAALAWALEHRNGISFDDRCESVIASVDGPRMSRAISELTRNAIQSARRSVTVQTRATDGELAVDVMDDGPGCDRPKGRFTPSLAQRGLGLGLPFAADVARLHGGTLVVAREGEITSVRIVVPR